MKKKMVSTTIVTLEAMAKKQQKYHAESLTIDGHRFDSLAEAKRYGELHMLQMTKAIETLIVHPKFPIYIAGTKICDVVLDFQYVKDHQFIYEDVKGFDNPLSRLKRKLLEAVYGFKVSVIKEAKR